jgi:hypothetical protein
MGPRGRLGRRRHDRTQLPRSLTGTAIWRVAEAGSMARMNVVVCVKQIPDPAEPGKLEADNTLDRSGKLILDESDSYGVETTLQLAEAAGGGWR